MRRHLAIAVAALLTASPALAEVADKEPSLGAMWAWALSFNLITIALVRVRPLLGLLVFPFAILSALERHLELSDPFVGPAILQELGAAYIALSYLSVTWELVGPLAILILAQRARRQQG